jgi:predicted DNA-binding transcriptional regulator YafY
MTRRTGTIGVRRSQTADLALLAALGSPPPATVEAVWLGALHTIRLSDWPPVDKARAINIALTQLRRSTIELDAITPTVTAVEQADSQALAHRLDVHALRHALSLELKLRIGDTDAKGRATQRTVWLLEIEDDEPSGAMLAWYEQQRVYWKLRFERVISLNVQPELTDAPQEVTRRLWLALSGHMNAEVGSRG